MLETLVANKDIEGLKTLMREKGLKLVGRKLVPINETVRQAVTNLSQLFDQRQLARKILLNSLK